MELYKEQFRQTVEAYLKEDKRIGIPRTHARVAAAREEALEVLGTESQYLAREVAEAAVRYFGQGGKKEDFNKLYNLTCSYMVHGRSNESE